MSKKQQQSANKPATKINGQTNNPTVLVFQPLGIHYSHGIAIIVALVSVLLYVVTFNHEFVLDDNAAIIYNNYVREGFSGIPKLMKVDFWHFMNLNLGYYRPLSLITLAIEQEFVTPENLRTISNLPKEQLLKMAQIGHVDNVLFYGLTGYVTTLMLQRLLQTQSVWFSALISLLFMAHPVHTEVVSNIKSRDEMLSFLNIAATLLFFLNYLDTKKIKYVLLSCFFMYLAYLSKESSITALGLIPIIAYCSRGLSFGKALASLVPFLVVTLLFFMQKKYFLGSLGGRPPMDIMVYPYSVEKTKFLSMFKNFAQYIRISVFPHPLVYDYSYNQVPSGSWKDATTWLGIILFTGLAGLGIREFFSRSIWGLTLAMFFAMLAPAYAFTLMRGGIMAERFLYAPVLAVAIAVVWAVFKFIPNSEDSPVLELPIWLKTNRVAVAVLAVIFMLSAFKTVYRATEWKNEITLFRADQHFTPENTNARKHLGDTIIKLFEKETDPQKQQELFKEGITNLKQATRIFPNYGEAYFGIGYAYHNGKPAQFDSAKYYYKKAMQFTPNFVVSYNNMGVIYQLTNHLDLASYYYNLAIRVNPNYTNAQTNVQNMLKMGINVQTLPDSILQKY